MSENLALTQRTLALFSNGSVGIALLPFSAVEVLALALLGPLFASSEAAAGASAAVV